MMGKTKGKRVAIYARVSTTGQTAANQVKELEAAAERHGWNVAQVFTDAGISGAKGRDKRPQFDKLLRGVARKEFDIVAAWSVDRLSRSLPDLVSVLQELHAKGVDLYLHTQGLDTSTPGGRAMFGMLGVFAEFERAIIQERVRSGLARAKRQGTRSGNAIGRPRVGDAVEDHIRGLASAGMGKLKIAREVGCGVSVVQRVLGQDVHSSAALG
jgi:DNA invertase Pin-like site-specific DNA recombinase